MENEQTTRSPGHFLGLLRDQAWLIALVVLLCGAAAFGYSKTQKRQYEAHASLVVQDPAGVTGLPTTSMTPQQLAYQEAPRVGRLAVAVRVKAVLKSPLSPAELSKSISTSVNANSNVLDIQATAGESEQAAAIANAFAKQDAGLSTSESRASFAAQAAALKQALKTAHAGTTGSRNEEATELGRLTSLASFAQPVQVASLATPPGSPSAPQTARNVLIGVVVGLLIGIGVADLRRARDRRMRRPEEIEAELELPLIGHISRNALGHGGASANGRRALTPADLESFRVLRQNLQLLNIDGGGLRSVAVTSALAQEGKSTIAAMLAHANAAAGKRTLLVECDLRRPTLAARLGLREAPGLSDYLAGNAEPREVVQTVEATAMEHPGSSNASRVHQIDSAPPRFGCITAGAPPRPAELLATERFRTFLAEVREAYDFVVIDTSPLLAVVDTLELLPLVDGVAICVRAAKTTRDDAAAIKDALGRTKERPAGVVLTGVTPRVDPYYHYYQSPAAA